LQVLERCCRFAVGDRELRAYHASLEQRPVVLERLVQRLLGCDPVAELGRGQAERR
jgi:hypothetical protein